jgi:hypothetical protein
MKVMDFVNCSWFKSLSYKGENWLMYPTIGSNITMCLLAPIPILAFKNIGIVIGDYKVNFNSKTTRYLQYLHFLMSISSFLGGQ